MILRILIVLLVMVLSPAVAAACDCAKPGNAFQEYMKVQALFVGKVTGFGKSEAGVPTVILEVGETFRGKLAVSTDVVAGDGSCRYDFKKDKTYIVYASGFSVLDNVLASHCGRTRELNNAELSALRTVSTKMTEAEATKYATAFAKAEGAELIQHKHISTTHVVDKHGADHWSVRYGLRPATPGGDFFVLVYSPKNLHMLKGR